MQIDDNDKVIIYDYWKTLIRKNISTIPTNKFIRKPYIEPYIIELSAILNEEELINVIIDKIDNNEILNEEIVLTLNNIIEFNTEEKNNIDSFFLKNEEDDIIYYKLSTNVILYQIKYFRFYSTIIELLFDSNQEENELYSFILSYIKKNKFEIKRYSEKNYSFKIFYYYITELFNNYLELFQLLEENNIIETKFQEKDIHNFFIKNIFSNWYNIYKKDILENKVNQKIKKYKINTNFLSKILCLPNA